MDDVVDHKDRAADFDLEILGHVEEAGLKCRRVGYRHLFAPPAGAPHDSRHLWHLMILDAYHQTAVAHTQERAGTANPCGAEVFSHECINQIVDIFVLNDRKYELHTGSPWYAWLGQRRISSSMMHENDGSSIEHLL